MFLGIDLGTSGVKVMLVDDRQQIIGSFTSKASGSRPESGWSEQDPADWIGATESTIEALKAEYSVELSKVIGIGLSGHMHGATLIDKSDEVIRPCMMWNDTRSHAQASRFDSDPIFRKHTGNIVFPGFTAPKVEWVREEEPENFDKLDMVLLPKDYLRLWLTGEKVSEMSDAAGTSWLDVEKREWSDDLLGACHLERLNMPRLVEGSEVSGYLRSELAAKWGMGGKVVVAGGAGDNAASAIGMGTVKEGSAFISLGTSGVLFAANNAFLPNAESAVHTFCHALPRRWHQMGVILSATDSLNWLSNITGETAEQLTNSFGEDLREPSKTLFLPYLGGERTPHNDAAVRGSFTNLEHQTGKAELTLSVLEGVSFAFLDNLNALREAGTDLKSAIAVGGGAGSNYWLKLIATVLNIEVELPRKGDFGAAMGATRLGMIAAGAGDADEICFTPKIERVFTPESDKIDLYQEVYVKFRESYKKRLVF